MNWKGRTDPKKFVGISGSFTVLVYKTAKSTPAEIILARYIYSEKRKIKCVHLNSHSLGLSFQMNSELCES